MRAAFSISSITDLAPVVSTQLRLLYPMPSSTQGVGSGESDWFVFDENAGTEKFWIVWSAKPLPEMQEALRFVNKNDFGEVKDRRADRENLKPSSTSSRPASASRRTRSRSVPS